MAQLIAQNLAPIMFASLVISANALPPSNLGS